MIYDMCRAGEHNRLGGAIG